MKYLDGYPELDLLSHALSFSSPSLRVSTRIEAYSCKSIKSEKRLFKTLEHDLVTDLTLSTSISPPEHHTALLESAFGPLDKRESRKILWLLIATLNLAFPDHDFSRVNAEEFLKEDSARMVLGSLSSALSQLRTSGSDPNYNRNFSSYPPATTSTLPSHPKGRQGGREKSLKGYSISATALQMKLRDLQGDNEMPTHPFLRQVLDPIIDLGDCEVFSYTPDIDSDPHAYQSDDEEEYTSHEDEDVDEEYMARRQAEDDLGWSMDGVVPSTPSTPSTPASISVGSSSFRRGHKRRKSSLSRRAFFPNSYDSGSAGFLMDEDVEPLSNAGGNVSGEAANNDDETGGLLWSSNYFFYNRKMRRILFISCWGRKLGQNDSNSHMEKMAIGKTIQRSGLNLGLRKTKRSSPVVLRRAIGEGAVREKERTGSVPAMPSFGQSINGEQSEIRRARSAEEQHHFVLLSKADAPLKSTPSTPQPASPVVIASPRVRNTSGQSRPYKRRASSAGNSGGRPVSTRRKSARKGN